MRRGTGFQPVPPLALAFNRCRRLRAALRSRLRGLRIRYQAVSTWFFVSDLHGRRARFERLFEQIAAQRPVAVLIGGDILPGGATLRDDPQVGDFVRDYLAPRILDLRTALGQAAPRVLLILGNDDPRCEEAAFVEAAALGAWEYIHERRARVDDCDVYGYGCVPPTPFRLKDWERYDVSRYLDPGDVSPEDGVRTMPVDPGTIRHGTIRDDLERLTGNADLSTAVLLFHAPPYRSALDRVHRRLASYEHAPLDEHVGSVAIRELIEARGPRVTLHGHIHESPRLAGAWRERIGGTWCFSAAHDGPELALVRFDPCDPAAATRELIRA